MAPLDYLTLTFDSLSGIAGLVLNTVFIYLLIFRTSRHLNSYSVLLLNACITDTLASLCVLYTISRQIPVTQTSGLGIYLGSCSVVSGWSCSIGFIIWMHCFSNIFAVLVISFAYRLYILSHPTPSRRTMIAVCVLCYVPTFLYVVALITSFFIHDGYESRRKELLATVIAETRPDLVDPFIYIGGKADKNTFVGRLSIHYVFGLGSLSVLFCHACRIKIQRKIQILTLSECTKRLHKQLIRALTMQHIIEVFMIAAISLFFVTYGKPFFHSRIIEHLVFILVAVVPSSNPAINMYCIAYYRRELARLIAALLPKPKHSSSPIVSNISHSIQCPFWDCVMYTLDFITIVSQSALGTCGVLLNTLFIYLVIFKSSKQLHAYSVLLLDMCINDMIASTCALYSISRQIPIGESGGLGVSLGPCRFVSSLSCSITFTIWMHCYANCLVVLILCFVFRLYVLKRSTPTRAQTTIVCIFSYLPTFLYAVILIHGQLESDNYSEHLKQLRELVIRTRPELLEPYVDLGGRSDKHSFTGILSIFYVIMLGPLTMIVCLVVRFQIQRILRRFESMSIATKRMNVQLLRALTIQNLVEFFMLILLLIFFLSFGGGFLKAQFIEHLVFILGAIIPVSNPIINLICITHYKREAKKLFFKSIEHAVGEIDKKASTTTF